MGACLRACLRAAAKEETVEKSRCGRLRHRRAARYDGVRCVVRPLPLPAQDQEALEHNFALASPSLRDLTPRTSACARMASELRCGERTGRSAPRARTRSSARPSARPGQRRWRNSASTSPISFARSLPLGHLPGSQRSGAGVHPRKVLHRNRSRQQIEPTPILRRPVRRRVRDSRVTCWTAHKSAS